MTFEEWFAAQGFGLSSLWSAVPSSELKVKFKECWEAALKSGVLGQFPWEKPNA